MALFPNARQAYSAFTAQGRWQSETAVRYDLMALDEFCRLKRAPAVAMPKLATDADDLDVARHDALMLF